MAPHDTNTPREARRHAVPLIGMAVLLALVLLGFLWWVSRAAQGPESPVTDPNPVEQAAPEASEPEPAN